jgi:NADH-quinone oxidoreductase subunit N
MTLLAVHPLIRALEPELWLMFGAGLLLMAGAAGSGRSRGGWAIWIALGSVLAAMWSTQEWAPQDPGGRLLADSLVWYARVTAFGVGLLLLLVNRHVPAAEERGEFFALVLFCLAGISLTAAANDLVLLFLALELVSVPTYILVGLSRRDIRAQEATGKYFFLGAFAAALTLYGFSFLYGAAGTTQLFSTEGNRASIAATLGSATAAADPVVLLGLLLSLTGLAFKLAAVPLHFYVADVYQGAASPVAGLLGFVPKFAGFIAFIRLLSMTGWSHGDALFWLLWGLSAATMVAGNTLALMQHNLKRMLAYSSVAHSGYMLVGLVAGPGEAGAGGSPMRNGPAALLFYIAVYAVMNLGAFAALACFRRPADAPGGAAADEDDSIETLEDLGGAGRSQPWAALALAICIVGLMGLPPTAGFMGKLYVFSAALSSEAGGPRHGAMIALVVIGVLNSAVGAAYYLRIVAACYLCRPAAGVRASRCPALQFGLAVCAVVALAVFLRPGSLYEPSQRAAVDVRPAGRVVSPDYQAASPSPTPR